MTIHLPNDLESSIEAVVHSGRFASVDDAMAEAARLLLRQIQPGRSRSRHPRCPRRRPTRCSELGGKMPICSMRSLSMP